MESHRDASLDAAVRVLDRAQRKNEEERTECRALTT